MRYLIAFLTAFTLISGFGAAQAAGPDEGLYAPVPPDGAAFVRFIDADPKASDLGRVPSAGGKNYDALEFGKISPYYVQKDLKVDLAFGEEKLPAELEAGKFYSAVLSGGKVTLVPDMASENRAKALVNLYNFSPLENVELKTSDGKIPVAGPAAPGAGASREMNAVKVDFAVFDKDGKSHPVEGLTLQRGAAYNVLVLESKPGEIKILTSQSKTDTTK